MFERLKIASASSLTRSWWALGPRRRARLGSAIDGRAQCANEFAIPMGEAAIAERAPSVNVRNTMRDVSRRLVSVLGVGISDVTKQDALRLMEGLVCAGIRRCHSVFFVNAHTLNVATDQPDYRNVLNSADFVFNDGTGVRWAARQRGIELRDNLCGTDLIPEFLQATGGRGYRYFLLGADPDTIEKTAAAARERFAGWTQVGYHHGFVNNGQCVELISHINAAKADVLLVGMGNPIQERWIRNNQSRLRVPLAIGVGGLFDHWIDKPRRAPRWVRRIGCEWMHKLLLQPHKWRRYLIGNPEFLYRMARSKRQDLAAMQSCDGATLAMAESLYNL